MYFPVEAVTLFETMFTLNVFTSPCETIGYMTASKHCRDIQIELQCSVITKNERITI